MKIKHLPIYCLIIVPGFLLGSYVFFTVIDITQNTIYNTPQNMLVGFQINPEFHIILLITYASLIFLGVFLIKTIKKKVNHK